MFYEIDWHLLEKSHEKYQEKKSIQYFKLKELTIKLNKKIDIILTNQQKSSIFYLPNFNNEHILKYVEMHITNPKMN